MIEIFFLLITIFFIFKLKETFGTRNEDENLKRQAIEEFFKHKNIEILDQKHVVEVKSPVVYKDFSFGFEITDNTKKILNKIDFDESNFLNGAENALEMVNQAFSKKDLDTLKELLSEESFKNFERQINQLKLENKNLISHLISILSKEIKEIRSVKDKISIDVLFEMEQINFIENSNGEVIFGNKKQIDVVKEIWTFSKDVNSDLNFWTVENINGDI